jgi:hypothetical protein
VNSRAVFLAKPRQRPVAPAQRPQISESGLAVSPVSASLSACLPMRSKLLVKVRPALFRKEDSAALELYALTSSWNRVSEPVRPFHIEVDIVRSPDDQGGCFQFLQAPFDFHRVRVVEGCEEALKVARAPLGAKRRACSLGYS